LYPFYFDAPSSLDYCQLISASPLATCVQRAKKDARADEQTDDDRKEAKKAKKAKRAAAAAAATATAAVAASSAATARVPSVNQLLTASGKDEKLRWALRCVPFRSSFFAPFHFRLSTTSPLCNCPPPFPCSQGTVQDTNGSATYKSLFNSSQPVRFLLTFRAHSNIFLHPIPPC
jgi:hypothetical protein